MDKKHGLTNEVTLVQETDENANEHNDCQPKTYKKLGIDLFNNLESDPKKSGAMSKYLTFPVFLFMFSTALAHNFTPMWKHDSSNRKFMMCMLSDF